MNHKKKLFNNKRGDGLHNKRRGKLAGRGKQVDGRKSALQLAKRQYEQKKKVAEEAKKAKEAERASKLEALKVNHEKRCRQRQKLNEKTKRGQPVMANRIDMLLSKIQTII